MASSANKTTVLVTRVVLVGVLAVLVVLLIFDQVARRKAQAAYDAVNALVEQEEGASIDDLAEVKVATPDVVQQKLGRQPDSPGEKRSSAEYMETYSWSSGIRRHTVYVLYRQSIGQGEAGKPLLTEVTMNQEPGT